MIIYGVESLRALRVHWTLQELGLSYKTEPIKSRSGETQTPNYTSLHPGQKIPYIQDGEVGISAHCSHLYLFGREVWKRGINSHKTRTASRIFLSVFLCHDGT